VSTPWVIGLDDPAAADAALVGGKGAGLRRLVALDARVPTGFVVLTAAFAAAMEGADDL
jgi:pyruvate, water dikinase